MCGHGTLATAFVLSQSLRSIARDEIETEQIEITFLTKSRGTVRAIVNALNKTSLDLPISHPRPYQGVLTVYPPIIALALDIVETDIKDIQVDESNEVYIQVDESVIDISTREIDTQKLVGPLIAGSFTGISGTSHHFYYCIRKPDKV